LYTIILVYKNCLLFYGQPLRRFLNEWRSLVAAEVVLAVL